jgi:hypothetical protein
MTLRGWVITVGLIVAVIFAVDAAKADTTTHAARIKKSKHVTKKKKVSATKAHAQTKPKAGGDLQTDVKFDDSVLHGQYQTPDEALARVENEKGLSDLIGVRKHFKDRLQAAGDQE